MRIIIDPRLKYNYASYYLLGLYGVCQDVIFDVTPFKNIPYDSYRSYNSGFMFVVKDNDVIKKVFIDTEDVACIFQDRYEWCDVYAMVNPTKEQVDEYSKLIPIGPEFGVTLGSMLSTVITCLKLYGKSKQYTKIPLKCYLRDYLYTNFRRRSIEMFERPCDIIENYVFHASTLWYNEFAAKQTNMYRGEFLKACQRADIQVDNRGGLFYLHGENVVREMPEYPQYKEVYKDFIYESRLSMDEYIEKTKRSIMVFNTPSVCACHGWKLGEYLCMGKAIISSPLSRVMPGEGLTHGQNVHFVENPEEIYDAVMHIKTDKEYRQRLEKGARDYYERYLAPKIVIKRIIEH